MNTYEVIKRLCEDRGTTITNLEAELGFSRGSLGKLKKGILMQSDRAAKVADYFGVSVDFLLTGEAHDGYYVNPETAEVAQKIFENKELRLLFDAAQNASPEDLLTVHQMLLALKRKEHPEYDDPA